MKPAAEEGLSNFINPGIQHGLGHMKGATTSFERRGGAFTVEGLTGGHLIGGSATSRTSLVNWDAGASNTPGFVKPMG
jgi:hypothetical protein